MDPWTSQCYKAVNVDQLSTPTDRVLVRVKRSFARGSIPIIDQETGEIIRYRPRNRPSFLAAAFVFGVGMIIGIVVVAWPL